MTDKSELFNQQVGGDHYSSMKIQPMEFFEANNVPANDAIAIRYILRHRKKNGAQDLDKAIDMLKKIKELCYGNTIRSDEIVPPVVGRWFRMLKFQDL